MWMPLPTLPGTGPWKRWGGWREWRWPPWRGWMAFHILRLSSFQVSQQEERGAGATSGCPWPPGRCTSPAENPKVWGKYNLKTVIIESLTTFYLQFPVCHLEAHFPLSWHVLGVSCRQTQVLITGTASTSSTESCPEPLHHILNKQLSSFEYVFGAALSQVGIVQRPCFKLLFGDSLEFAQNIFPLWGHFMMKFPSVF